MGMTSASFLAWMTIGCLALVPGRGAADPGPASAGFVAALVDGGPAPRAGDDADLYDPFLGSWDLDIVEFQPDGGRRSLRGEWHFARVLEGRAVQDVLVVPPLAAHRAGESHDPPDTYGTTLRVYRPETATWAVTWFDPGSALEVRVVGRRAGREVVQAGTLPDGSLFRWIFSEVTAASFRWRREVSRDQGASWTTTLEFRARRRGTAPSTPDRLTPEAPGS